MNLSNFSLRSRRFRGRIRNGKSLEGEAKKREKLEEASARARGKWEGRKIKRLPENASSPANAKS